MVRKICGLVVNMGISLGFCCAVWWFHTLNPHTIDLPTMWMFDIGITVVGILWSALMLHVTA